MIDQAARVTVAAFYKFVDIDDPVTLQRELRLFCAERDIKGTILLAHEGINATISGPETDVAAVVSELRSDSRFASLTVKYSNAASHPFQRFKVKIKREIVTFGVPDLRPSAVTGHLVEPKDWNALISDPDVLVIDTRNDYEVGIGTFEGARNPRTRAFSEFRDYVAAELQGAPEKKIAMFCTGGIRCEKASSYLLARGFTDVYQLSGGILKYLEEIPSEQSLWRGECFVFDERVALEHGVHQGHHELCARCGQPRRADDAINGDRLCVDCRRSTRAVSFA
ncbi:rhodanese [Hyphomicrobium denitrificans 1NES1]|uniref:tRNA uridine(34) hydroxylase n=1 Tax=Hyphomicrobium denitrificans 1NES1 TaxID=670307 RepID=N0B6A7_9HYPH|nr:rhodanese-related sulfurtransferase [Hyphomicrobium denitrificans]AGK59109.1 rhodanese [Hyphomicrobium denitrificans 1NES1]